MQLRALLFVLITIKLKPKTSSPKTMGYYRKTERETTISKYKANMIQLFCMLFVVFLGKPQIS